jgi:hypothetical protein
MPRQEQKAVPHELSTFDDHVKNEQAMGKVEGLPGKGNMFNLWIIASRERFSL